MITAAYSTPKLHSPWAGQSAPTLKAPISAPETVAENRESVEISAYSHPAPPVTLVDVSHTRELRGAWVASVFNINFPSSNQLNAEQQKEEMTRMLDQLKECGFNSVFFQVRPEGDALYRSDLEPWSSSLTGQQGKDPGYDPLAFMIEQARERNLEVHAWLNPYRAKAASAQQVLPHIGALHPELVHDYGDVKWMDPGSEVVRERLVKVCADLTERYDIDGIHFDDYFYPYPNGKSFPDEATYQQYQRQGGTLALADWRRQNVNEAVRQVDEAIESRKDYVRFGISPFGLPAPDRPEGVVGFDQYEGLYADTQKWMDEGWVDYLAPQLYWPTTKKGQPYETLVKWWNDHSKDNRAIFAGNNLQAVGSNSGWTIEEYRKEAELSRLHSGPGGAGNIWWNVEPILKDKPGVRDLFKNELYARPALSPVMPEAVGSTVHPPSLGVNGREITPIHNDRIPLRAWTVYRQEGDQWTLDRVVPSSTEKFELEPGTWAVAAAAKSGVESKGVQVEIKA